MLLNSRARPLKLNDESALDAEEPTSESEASPGCIGEEVEPNVALRLWSGVGEELGALHPSKTSLSELSCSSQ